MNGVAPAESAKQPAQVSQVIDAAVHPMQRSDYELRDFMPAPWKSLPFPSPHRVLYPPPTGEPNFGAYIEESRPPNGLPASTPQLLREQLDSRAVDRAVLVPLTRGLMPNIDLGTQICAATNRWLAERWLATTGGGSRFYGSIRVNPSDVAGAVSEIKRWATHPSMVQIAIPFEAHAPYGQRNYFPIWKAAVENGLPVAVYADAGAGVNFQPTANGFPRHFIEYSSLYPINFIYHLSSLITEGTLGRLPELRFLFGEGGFDMMMPLVWRLDVEWPSARAEIPWLTKRPSAYLHDHVYFATSRFERPPAAELSEWFQQAHAKDHLLFASRYPHWLAQAPADWLPDLPETERARVLYQNAQHVLRLPSQA